jgi:hypothetical protein
MRRDRDNNEKEKKKGQTLENVSYFALNTITIKTANPISHHIIIRVFERMWSQRHWQQTCVTTVEN